LNPTAVAEPCKWFGETAGFWIQTSVLAVSAIAAVWVIRASKTQEKRRATIDLIMDQKRDPNLVVARKKIIAMHESGEKNFSRFLSTPASDEYKNILLVLNAYEFVASGIREGAFDEYTYKRLRYFNLIRDWNALSAFVTEFQNSKRSYTLFQDFAWLGKRWMNKPLKADRKQPIPN
jgi:hypothetical protein